MRKLIVIVSVLLCGAASAYSQTELYASGTFGYWQNGEVQGTGTVMLKSGTWIIRVSDREGTTDYVPSNLEENFKVEGTQVKFVAQMEEVPEGVRMLGVPVKVIKIERLGS